MSTEVRTSKKLKVPTQSTAQAKLAEAGKVKKTEAKKAEPPVVSERKLKKKPKAEEKKDRIPTSTTAPEINAVAGKKAKRTEKKTDDIGAGLPPVRRGYGSMPTATWNQADVANVQQAIIVQKARMAKKSQAGDIAADAPSSNNPPRNNPPPVPRRGSMPTMMLSSSIVPEGTLSPSSLPPARRPPIPPVRTKPFVKSDTEPTSGQSKTSTQDSDTSPSTSAESAQEPKSPRSQGPGAQPLERLKPSQTEILRTTGKQEKQAPSVLPSVSGSKAESFRKSADFDLDSLLALMNDESLLSDSDNSVSALAGNSSQAPVAGKASGGAKKEKLAREYFGELFKSHQRALQALKIFGSVQSVHDALPDELVMSEVNHSADALYNAMINASVDENQRTAFVDVAVDLAKREKAFGPSQKDHILQVLVVRIGNVWASKLAETHGDLSEDFAKRAKIHAARAEKFAELAKKLS